MRIALIILALLTLAGCNEPENKLPEGVEYIETRPGVVQCYDTRAKRLVKCPQ